MYIIISNSSDVPIYRQISDRIREMILSGELCGGSPLPSIRTLAHDLKISNITTRRAYDELEKAGFIESSSTRGYFVRQKNSEYLKEEILTDIEESISGAVNMSRVYGVSKEELHNMIDALYDAE